MVKLNIHIKGMKFFQHIPEALCDSRGKGR
jgi:hypothetical protein